MDIQSAIRQVVERSDLAFDDMHDVMEIIMCGEATPAQIAGLLVALRMKGETVDEAAAAASVMREFAVKVETGLTPLIDTCGTGGDGIGTFNISTAAAFVTAAAGGRIAKHGNRAASSKSGSADLLEAAGAKIDLNAEQVAACIREVGLGFMFAPAHHGATRHAVGPRRELGTRTLFNVLGPLTNPANADRQLMGVFDPEWVPRAAEVLNRLGVFRALVVCAADGMDEISISGPTHVAELKGGEVTQYDISPEDFGIQSGSVAALHADNAADSFKIIQQVFGGAAGAARDIVLLNAAAAIYVGDLCPDMTTAIKLAAAVIDDGRAKQKLEQFVAYTRSFA